MSSIKETCTAAFKENIFMYFGLILQNILRLKNSSLGNFQHHSFRVTNGASLTDVYH